MTFLEQLVAEGYQELPKPFQRFMTVFMAFDFWWHTPGAAAAKTPKGQNYQQPPKWLETFATGGNVQNHFQKLCKDVSYQQALLTRKEMWFVRTPDPPSDIAMAGVLFGCAGIYEAGTALRRGRLPSCAIRGPVR